MKTVAELYRNGKIIRSYKLKHDDKGFYFDGMCCASWRRKKRESAEKFANSLHYDIVDYSE